MSKYSYVDAYLDATDKFMKEKTKKYEIVYRKTLWEFVEISASSLEEAKEIAENEKEYCSENAFTFDSSSWEVSDISEVKS